MYFNKHEKNGYIIAVSKSATSGNISEDEYDLILEIINNKPPVPENKILKLKTDLTWEISDAPISET